MVRSTCKGDNGRKREVDFLPYQINVYGYTYLSTNELKRAHRIAFNCISCNNPRRFITLPRFSTPKRRFAILVCCLRLPRLPLEDLESHHHHHHIVLVMVVV